MASYSVAYGEERIGFVLRRQARLQGRVAIHVTPDGAVLVDAPPESDLADVKQAVRQRAPWVWRQLQAQHERRRHVLPRDYVSGETHFYLGRRYQLKLLGIKQSAAPVRLWRGRLEVATDSLGAHAVRDPLEAWYRERAKLVFGHMLLDISKTMGLADALPPWRLLALRTQWGSCSARGELLLNPALVKAPKTCIAYVLTHELCHLTEHNHSGRFYRLLGAAMPDWARRKQELDGLAELMLNR